uniref:Guanylate-binding protein N-terminal domain-containing protein n=1 Tax=Palpitomonas bilix TaxID=652834 RepID=A0A7S3D0A7_9EUKA|mmetsp:Transcript_15962/g.40375  ORF Transcript_15962/g.40375 Transcript_15962/m.40375 type:complete len:558 (+) Transcript_15962:80-1753(+)
MASSHRKANGTISTSNTSTPEPSVYCVGKWYRFLNASEKEDGELSLQYSKDVLSELERSPSSVIIGNMGGLQTGKSTFGKFFMQTSNHTHKEKSEGQSYAGRSGHKHTKGILCQIAPPNASTKPSMVLLDSQGLGDSESHRVHAVYTSVLFSVSDMIVFHARGTLDRLFIDSFLRAAEGRSILRCGGMAAKEQEDREPPYCVLLMHDATAYLDEIDANKKEGVKMPYDVTHSPTFTKVLKSFAEVASGEGGGNQILDLRDEGRFFAFALPPPTRKQHNFLKQGETNLQELCRVEEEESGSGDFADGLAKVMAELDVIVDKVAKSEQRSSGTEFARDIISSIDASRNIHYNERSVGEHYESSRLKKLGDRANEGVQEFKKSIEACLQDPMLQYNDLNAKCEEMASSVVQEFVRGALESSMINKAELDEVLEQVKSVAVTAQYSILARYKEMHPPTQRLDDSTGENVRLCGRASVSRLEPFSPESKKRRGSCCLFGRIPTLIVWIVTNVMVRPIWSYVKRTKCFHKAWPYMERLCIKVTAKVPLIGGATNNFMEWLKKE